MKGAGKTAKLLIVSIMAMMICGVLFLGTTQAWFQETVTASVRITAETVSVDLQSAERGINPIVFYEVLTDENGNTTLFSEPADIWDLGKVYQTPVMTLVNTGSLKAAYTVTAEGIEDIWKEAFVFEVISEDGTCRPMPFTGELEVQEGSKMVSFQIQVHLDADKAASAAGVNLENIVINVTAVQAE